MRIKQLQLLLLGVVIGSAISCNQVEKNEPIKQAEQPKIENINENDTITDCDYYVDQNTTREMINDFAFRYKKSSSPSPVRGLLDSLWVDSCVFTALRNFFDTADRNYDGIRIFHIGNTNTRLLFVPTSLVTPSTTTYQHLNRFDPESKINLRTNCSSTIVINNDEILSRKLIDDFGVKFRKETARGNRLSSNHDSLSAGVWFSKCKIQHMARVLEDRTKDVNGMIVYSASYLRRPSNYLEIGQKHERQSTLILVPGKKTGSTYEANWSAVSAPTAALVEKVKFGGYNHGSLCPNICN